MDATNNWWGAEDGPSGANSGVGDAVSSNVTFTPFLTQASCPLLQRSVDPLALLPMPTSANSLMCVQAQSEENWSFSIIPVAEAARFEPGQCTDWLDQQYPELIAACLPSSGADAHRWDELFADDDNCNFPVSGEPQVGDIAVWEISRGYPYGHVAYVTAVEGNQVAVSEYNVGELQRYTERGERPTDAGTAFYPTDGLNFIHIKEGIRSLVRTLDVYPIRAEGQPSFISVQVPQDRLYDPFEEETQGLLIYRGNSGWSGMFFDKVGEENGVMLFYVDGAWENNNPGWQNFYMKYLYVSRPSQQ